MQLCVFIVAKIHVSMNSYTNVQVCMRANHAGASSLVNCLMIVLVVLFFTSCSFVNAFMDVKWRPLCQNIYGFSCFSATILSVSYSLWYWSWCGQSQVHFGFDVAGSQILWLIWIEKLGSLHLPTHHLKNLVVIDLKYLKTFCYHKCNWAICLNSWNVNVCMVTLCTPHVIWKILYNTVPWFQNHFYSKQMKTREPKWRYQFGTAIRWNSPPFVIVMPSPIYPYIDHSNRLYMVIFFVFVFKNALSWCSLVFLCLSPFHYWILLFCLFMPLYPLPPYPPLLFISSSPIV